MLGLMHDLLAGQMIGQRLALGLCPLRPRVGLVRRLGFHRGFGFAGLQLPLKGSAPITCCAPTMFFNAPLEAALPGG